MMKFAAGRGAPAVGSPSGNALSFKLALRQAISLHIVIKLRDLPAAAKSTLDSAEAALSSNFPGYAQST
jgi:hypothetical protein